MIWLAAMGPARIAGIVITVVLFALLCAATLWRERRRRQAAQQLARALLPAGDASGPVLVAHASQTGTAEQLAWQSAQALQLAGVSAQVMPLGALTHQMLGGIERALFIVSTYGEGDPPDTAAPFVRNIMLAGHGDDGALPRLHFAVLALGDRTYANFCGFGRTLDQWLRDQRALPLFERIDADRQAEPAITRWRHQLAHLAGTRDAPDWAAPEFAPWQLTARTCLNPGSAGEPACHLALRPAHGAALPEWEAGDLLQVRVPGEPQPREYSIASIPADGAVELLVRLARRADGSVGKASAWLIEGVAPGGLIEARIRAHRGFRLGDNAARPLILIGNGTGIAGLRALLKAREVAPAPASADRRCWLVFGERSARHDAFHAADIARWRQSGLLTRCDLVWSRDQPERRYVQHVLAGEHEALRQWVTLGAAIYVCGSLQGMAAEVDAVLAAALGREHLDQLIVDGRYRRDVY